jgi:hypothetical protein
MNPYFERLKVVKENELMTIDKLLQVATVFFTWGKLTEEEYDYIVA